MNLLRNVIALGLIVAAGWAHGNWTNRWSISPAVQALSARVQQLPSAIDEWSSESNSIDPRELRAAGGAVALHRSYRAIDAAPVEVFLIAGRAAPISSHAPDVCYPGAGFVLGPIERVLIDGQETKNGHAEFATAIATKSEPGHTDAIRLYWAWNDGSGWRAPLDPRMAFLSAPALCKLYLITPATAPNESVSIDDSSRSLLGRLASQYGVALFQDRPGGAAGRSHSHSSKEG